MILRHIRWKISYLIGVDDILCFDCMIERVCCFDCLRELLVCTIEVDIEDGSQYDGCYDEKIHPFLFHRKE